MIPKPEPDGIEVEGKLGRADPTPVRSPMLPKEGDYSLHDKRMSFLGIIGLLAISFVIGVIVGASLL